MSLVGPRPPIPYEVESYQKWHLQRLLEAKPGITGLWQVKGRSKTTFDEMVRLDLRYARTWSIWLDLLILLQTPRAVLSGVGGWAGIGMAAGLTGHQRAGKRPADPLLVRVQFLYLPGVHPIRQDIVRTRRSEPRGSWRCSSECDETTRSNCLSCPRS